MSEVARKRLTNKYQWGLGRSLSKDCKVAVTGQVSSIGSNANRSGLPMEIFLKDGWAELSR